MKRVFAIVVSMHLVAAALVADADKARKRLERDGNAFTVDAFLTQVFLGETKTVELYLEAGMSPDAADEKGWSALHRAAQSDSDRTLAVLLKAKPKIDPRTDNGDTPLCRAAASEKPKNVDLLIKAGADINAACSFAKTPLHEAASEGDAQSIAFLLAAHANIDPRDSHNETPLVLAAHNGSVAVVGALLKAGADVNARGNSGNTPLHEAVSSDNFAVAKMLLDAGADPNAKNAAGQTPLYEAARFGRPKVIPALLAAGADPNLKVDRTTTPLSAAREEGNKETISMLESAKPVVPKVAAKTPAMPPVTQAPATAADAAVQLKKMGITTIDADTLFRRVEARDVRAATLLIAAGVKPNVRDDVGRPPLWEAIEHDDLPMVKALIAAGADVNDPGKAPRKEFESGETLVMLAADRDDPQILAAMIAAGADVNKANMYGVNALDTSAMQGKPEHVKVLIEGKANVNALDKAGTPVLFSAVQGGNVAVLKMLLDAGAKIGPHKKLLIDTADSNKNAEMKAMLTSAAAKEPASSKTSAKPVKKTAVTTPAWEQPSFPKPVALAFGKKPVTGKQVYDVVLPIARKWQDDAELTDLGTTSEGRLDASGRSSHWVAHFFSRSAQKVNLMSINDGSLIATIEPSNELRIVPITETTILDTARLNQIADDGGAKEYAGRATRPMVSLIRNPRAGVVWYFNYDDLATQKNILTIIIDANSGNVTFKDAK